VKIAIVLNGISLEKKKFFKNFLPPLKASFQVDLYETQSKNAAISLAGKAVTKGYDAIISAGGDGTLHQVVNGVLMESNHINKLPIIGVLPIGTGNDFTRSLDVSLNPWEFIDRFKNFQTIIGDLGTVKFSSTPHKT
jgi:diacylglycerol kinase (ATP)